MSSIVSCSLALLFGGAEEAMPGGPGHAHSEDLQRLEVPHTLPAAQTESDHGGRLVPEICSECSLNNEELLIRMSC